MCNALVNMEAVRVLYKHVYGFGVRLFSIYMSMGGTNWCVLQMLCPASIANTSRGNLGYMNGNTSYDYGVLGITCVLPSSGLTPPY